MREIYRNFQPPLPDPGVPGSAKAIREGKEACEGMTPKQVALRFRYEAELSQDQRQALKQLPRAEAHPTADFVAGQLAAMAYEGTLEGETATFGYRGCVYVLARGVEERLAGKSPPAKSRAQG